MQQLLHGAMIALVLSIGLWSWRSAPAQVVLDRDELSSWADALFEPSFAQRRFSGAAIVVVQNGEVLLSKGYGYADLALRKPIDLQSTKFQIASITKTFTGTAIAQLVDRGLIESLDDPANKYLKRVSLPQAYGRQITLRHLLTHRGGFEDSSYAMFADPARVSIPLEPAEIERLMVGVVREPGSLSVYSNFGFGILGLVVEDVTGMTLEEYFSAHIFEPLGMRDTFVSGSAGHGSDLAIPYGYFPNGELKRTRPALGHPLFAAAGDIESSPMDMARYMIAQLEEGRGGAGILSQRMFAELHRRHAGNHSAVEGFGLGFMVGDWNGERYVSHGGHLPGYMSKLVLLLDSNIGFYVTVMIGDASLTLEESIMERWRPRRSRRSEDVVIERPLTQLDVENSFLMRFLGQRKPPAEQSDGELHRYAGAYLSERRPFGTFEKAFQLLTPQSGFTKVEVTQGGLSINGVGPYVQVDEGVFWKGDAGPDITRPISSVFESPLYAFLINPQGEVTHMNGYVSTSISGRLPVAWPQIHARLLRYGFWICLTGVAAVLWRCRSRAEKGGRALTLALFAMMLLAAALLTLGFSADEPLPMELPMERLWRFLIIIGVANATAVLALVGLWMAVGAWRRNLWGTGLAGFASRVHFSFVVLGAVLLIAPFWYGNLLGLHW
ncbi:MAG TPA: serine hydrolase domain-containing protein [Steroidobacter sp.]|uniref:serine hydrolase domain-containing protein n=1 Tax=Steroidobacter sp. TaxID=1978227 RepID=UPI002EDB781B